MYTIQMHCNTGMRFSKTVILMSQSKQKMVHALIKKRKILDFQEDFRVGVFPHLALGQYYQVGGVCTAQACHQQTIWVCLLWISKMELTGLQQLKAALKT